ncbi:hypothetical protein G9A89_021736 [Geosiphon pyriformis]|nr:hypothetical protein G9A89_021736 [Geosiphon pyriformis]
MSNPNINVSFKRQPSKTLWTKTQNNVLNIIDFPSKVPQRNRNLNLYSDFKKKKRNSYIEKEGKKGDSLAINLPIKEHSKVSPKILVPLYGDTWQLLARMVRFANLPHCRSDNNVGKSVPGIIGCYFRGPGLRIKEFENERVELAIAAYTFPPPIGTVRTMVHQLWSSQVQKFLPDLYRKIQHFIDVSTPRTNLKIYFSGHGIGGAYALLAAMSLQEQILKVPNKWDFAILKVITFGQPRVGIESFANLANRVLQVFRVTHSNDRIPQYPPRVKRFLHVEREFWVQSDDDCNCQAQFSLFPGSNVLECPGIDKMGNGIVKPGENPECNARQGGSKISSLAAHLGPYFGETIGSCSVLLEDGFRED